MNIGGSRLTRLWRKFAQSHKEYRKLQKEFETRMREQRRSEALAAGGTRAWFERLAAPASLFDRRLRIPDLLLRSLDRGALVASCR
ncbi:hypothetical protein [Cohnella rhizosphaerae]|uniref:Uncharacterized protein n=1 Tax=Cohnella rhizosphaerae TaxID=1457232 RepID=A0A9X4QV31_9BACL|nr:hypothetical protein [Cohnella rhizosphaerae]MDG0812876.1 hypothetical protein [Cohnella rhizosphaerae]